MLYDNAEKYCAEVPLAQQICNMAINIWQQWGEDLMQHLEGRKEG
jgi:hypothetical protein